MHMSHLRIHPAEPAKCLFVAASVLYMPFVGYGPPLFGYWHVRMLFYVLLLDLQVFDKHNLHF